MLTVLPVCDSGALFSSCHEQFSWCPSSPLQGSSVILQLSIRLFQETSSFSPVSNPKTMFEVCVTAALNFQIPNFVLLICCCLTTFSTSRLKVENVYWKELKALYTLFSGLHEKRYSLTYACPHDFSFSAYFCSEYNTPLHHSLSLAVLEVDLFTEGKTKE